MSVVIRYALNMLPYMLLSIPFYLAARIIFARQKRIPFAPWHEFLLLLFVIFAVGLASQTVVPKFQFGVTGFSIIKERIHETNLIPFKVFYDTWREVITNNNLNYFLINFLGNIILFIPFGLFTQLLWDIPRKRSVAIGFSVSFFIEFCQLFLARGTDIDDLMLNTFGAFLGVLIYTFLQKAFPKVVASFRLK